MKVSKEDFLEFLGKSGPIWAEKINWSTPKRKNYYADPKKKELIAYEYEAFNDLTPEEFYIFKGRRTLFGNPIRVSTTQEMYPDKVTFGDFASGLREDLGAMEHEMEGFEGEVRYVEEWVETFLAWCEIEEERDVSN